jgi:uncharacterized protein (UPF0333 family)
MKNKFSSLTALVGLFMIVVLFSGCSLFPPYDVEFINNSTYDVAVSDLKDCDTPSFVVPVDGKKTVSVDSTQIQFMFAPAYYVEADIDSTDNKVTFSDR